MSRRRQVHEAPARSAAHIALRAAAREAGQDEEALRDLLWLVNAPDTLLAFARIGENLARILQFVEAHWADEPTPISLDVALRLKAPAEWIAEQSRTLALQDALAPMLVTRENGRNPLLSTMASRHPLCTALWHIAESPVRRERYDALQAQLLIACVNETYRGSQARSEYESYCGIEMFKTMPNSPYQATLAVRDWSREIPFGPWLEDLAVMATPPEFVKHAGTMHIHDKLVAGRLDELLSFIGKAVGERKWVIRGRATQGGSGGHPVVTGYIEVAPGVHLDPLILGDPDDPDSSWGEISQVISVEQTKLEQDEILRRETDPGEDEDDEFLVLGSWAEPRDGSARGENQAVTLGQLRHLRMVNQLLPWSYSELGLEEVARVLKACSERWAGYGEIRSWGERQHDELEVMALLQVMLWTGSDLERAMALMVVGTGAVMRDSPLILEIPKPESDARPTWIVRARVARRMERQDVAGDLERIDELHLQDRWRQSFFVLRWLRSMEDPDAFRKQATRVFARRITTYRSMLKEFLGQYVDPSGRVTAGKIGHVMFFNMLRRGADIALVNSFLGSEDHRLARVRMFYSAPRVATIVDLYDKACGEFWDAAKAAMARSPTQIPAYVAEHSELRLRGRAMPAPGRVVRAIKELKARLRNAVISDRATFVAYVNDYTLYTVWMFEFATGCRAIRTPYLAASAVDRDSGLASWADKDDGSGHKRRLIWIPPTLREQMAFHAEHWQRMRRSVLCLFADAAPCRFFDAELRALEVRPQTLIEFKRPFLDFGANMHRHFMRAALLERGVGQEIVDAYLGHWHFGEEPWDDLSSLSPVEYLQVLQPAVTAILDELGFEAIESVAP